MSTENPAPDPVVVYDILREAANRLCAYYAERVTKGGLEDPAIEAIRRIRSRVRAVPLSDMQSQLDLTDALKNELAALDAA